MGWRTFNDRLQKGRAMDLTKLFDLRLQLPYSPSVSIQNHIRNGCSAMPLSRDRKQVFNAIIIFNAIQVMDNPTCRKLSPIIILPNLNVFKDTPRLICPMMPTGKNSYISSLFGFSTLPTWMIRPLALFYSTGKAHFSRRPIKHWFATFRARLFPVGFCPSFNIFQATLTLITNSCLRAALAVRK